MQTAAEDATRMQRAMITMQKFHKYALESHVRTLVLEMHTNSYACIQFHRSYTDRSFNTF